jgi:very-short-patch-repair endonuclease
MRINRNWTNQEIDYLKRNYQKLPVKQISVTTKRSKPAIYIKAKMLKLQPAYRKGRLTEKEILIFKKYFGRITCEKIKKKFFPNKSANRIRVIAYELRKKKIINIYSKLPFSKNTREKSSKTQKRLWRNEEYKNKQLKKMTENWNLKPNIPERQIMQIIKLNKLPFNYTGDNKLRIEGFNPDFLSKNPKYIIEFYGEYHHNLPRVRERDIRRRKAYNSLGYKLLVIWGNELKKNPQRVTEKIINFLFN